MRTVLVLGVVAARGWPAAAPTRTARRTRGPQVVVTTNILGDVVEQPRGRRRGRGGGDAPERRSARLRGVGAAGGVDARGRCAGGQRARVRGGAASTPSRRRRTTACRSSRRRTPSSRSRSGEGDDPHLFTDPVRMREAADADRRPARGGDPRPRHARRWTTRVAGLPRRARRARPEVEAALAGIPPDDRVLVTNHEVFGYFADRYDFEVLGAIIPGGSTLAEPSAADLADLAREIDERGVPAIFAETSVADSAGRRAGRRGRRRRGGRALQRVPRRAGLPGRHLHRHGPHRTPSGSRRRSA